MELPYPVRLRSGYVAVRRDERTLQIGLDAPARAFLPDTAEVRRLLVDLERGVDGMPPSLGARRALDTLVAAGLVEAAHPAPPAAAVAVDAPEEVRTALAPVLRSAALRIDDDATVTLVADNIPVRRDRVDPLLRVGRPHLVVAGDPDGWTVGPFVAPGVTACVRCVDAHLGHDDPRRAIVLDQLASVPRSLQAIDPLTRLTALCLAAADLREFLAGRTPATWSATYRIGPGAPVCHDWARHPHCGCAWDLLASTL